jgi:hypothetical protein
LGNRQFVSQDDFFIKNDRCAEQITIDVLIVPVDNDFSEDWEVLFTTDRIRHLEPPSHLMPLKTAIKYNKPSL